MTDGVRPTLRVIVTTVLVPLVILGLGLWELQRGRSGQWELQQQQDSLRKLVMRMEARIAAEPRREMEVQFRRNGQLYGGPYAVQKAREALDDAGTALATARWRRVLPPVTILCAGLIAMVSVSMLVGAAALGRNGRRSRDALVRGFSVLHRLMPPLLGLQVLLLASCAVTVVGFEALALFEVGDFSSGSLKVLAIAAMLIGASLWTALKAVLQLRRTVALFEPDPMLVLGRPVSPDEAPGLWRLLDNAAERLGALRPNTVVVGLTGGFFVASGAKRLRPGDIPIEGRTLYLPLPYLPLLRADELAAIVSHELAHFSGSDTDYSLRFLPIYVGVERSLAAVIAAGTTSAGSLSLLTRPAVQLGLFAMERFHHTVLHWSRLREFAADSASAESVTADAAARALLRTAAVEARIRDMLDTAWQAPETAPRDLVVATVAHATTIGMDNPTPRLEQRQPHPTDTHPPTIQRLAALGWEADAASLAEAMAPPSPDAMARLSSLFADPEALCRAATVDFLDRARDHAEAARQALEAAASAVDPAEQVLYENVQGAGFVLLGTGVAILLVGLLLVAVGLRGLGLNESRLVGGFAAAIGLFLATWGGLVLRRGRAPFLLLRPDGLTLPGLDRPIAWAHLADLDMAIDRGAISTRLLLLPGAPFPRSTGGGRKVKLDLPRRIVTFRAGTPRGMKAQDYAELFHRYRKADFARRELAEARRDPKEI